MQHVLVIEDHVETRQWLVAIVKEAFSDPVIEEAGTLEQAYACLETFIPSVMLAGDFSVLLSGQEAVVKAVLPAVNE